MLKWDNFGYTCINASKEFSNLESCHLESRHLTYCLIPPALSQGITLSSSFLITQHPFFSKQNTKVTSNKPVKACRLSGNSVGIHSACARLHRVSMVPSQAPHPYESGSARKHHSPSSIAHKPIIPSFTGRFTERITSISAPSSPVH